MATKCVYLCPGLMGSQLWYDDHTPGRNDGTLLWPNFTRIAARGIGPLLVPHPEPLVPDGHLWVYKDLDLVMRLRLPPEWDVATYAWDWTLNIRDQAKGLAQRIYANRKFYPDGQAVVGHSAGGVLAVAAFIHLRAGTEGVPAGSQGLLKRIVSLGGPLRGSYDWPAFFSGLQPATLLFTALTLPSVQQSPFAFFFSGRIARKEIFRVASTWQAHRDTFPHLAGPDYGVPDPDRSILYMASTWASSQAVVTQESLDYLADDFQPWITNGASIPPHDVLTCVAGTHQDETKVRVVLAKALGHLNPFERSRIRPQEAQSGDPDWLPSYAEDSSGDNCVAPSGAVLPGARVYYIMEGHSPMVSTATVLGNIVRWITEDPPPGPPAGPVLADIVPFPHTNDPPTGPAVFNDIPAVLGTPPGGRTVTPRC